MTLRKVKIDNSVRYISKDDHSHTEQAPPISNTRKKSVSNKILSQKNKKLLKFMTGEGIRMIKSTTNYYF